MLVPTEPKIYHIVHVDRLSSIIADGCLWSDSAMVNRQDIGTTIGISQIKERRLNLKLNSHPDLHVSGCVPFYFCPRSVMLYLIHRADHPELIYRGGQKPIVHLEADLRRTVDWANANKRRWAFTLSNAGAYYFEDFTDLNQLSKISWDAVQARDWQEYKHGKQAEFLIEHSFPWSLVSRIGVHSTATRDTVLRKLHKSDYSPLVDIKRDWYY